MSWPGTVNVNKDASPQAYAPLLLAVFTFIDGSVVRFSTHPLNAAEGGYQYGGHDYLARVDSQDIGALQARSEQGIERVPSATIHLMDSDHYIWSNYEKSPAMGFKGAILSLSVVLFSLELDGTFTYSTDSPMLYTGICSAPILENGGQVISISSSSSRNMAKVMLPPVLNQSRCTHTFPSTAAERLDGVTNRSSQFWECSYNPDQTCTDPITGSSGIRGNFQSGSTPYTTCDYTKQSCVARGMYAKDSSNRKTGAFDGEQWMPPSNLRESQSKSYIDGKNITVFQNGAQNSWNKPVPMLYGQQWVKGPPIITQIEDGNSTRCEVVVCSGDIGSGGVHQVVCNGEIVPATGYDPLFRWNFGGNPLGSHTGGRLGSATNDAGWNDGSGNPTGDPHGSKAVIEVVVYHQLVGGGQAPTIQILASGPKVWVFSSPSASTFTYSNNSAWVMLDVLTYSNWQYAEIDIASFIAEATYSDVAVSYTDLNGASASHTRYICEFALVARRSAGELIQQILDGFNAELVRDPVTALLQLKIRKTLADQQGSAVSGSNYNTAISSVTAAGASANGYAAYHLSEATIASDGRGIPKFRYYSRSNSDTANRIMFPFQDSDNAYQDDSINLVDSQDTSRAGGYQGSQEVSENFNVLGISNFDQAIRIARCRLAENLRGNEAGDTRGTRYIDCEIRSGVRVAHLRKSHIVIVSWAALGLVKQPFRVIGISPTTNFESCKLQLRWHNDTWYTDAYGQSPAQVYSGPARRGIVRPYPWQPDTSIPVRGDSMFPQTWRGFDIIPSYTVGADGAGIVLLSIQGRIPANDLSALAPPFVPMQGVTAATGGSIAAGNYLIGICAIDANGKYSPISNLVRVSCASGTTNTIGATGIYWQGSPSDYAVFAGPSTQELCYQSDSGHAGTPSSITLTALNIDSFGPPDLRFDHFRPEVKEEIHSGVFAEQISVLTSTTIKFSGASFTTNQFSGKTVSLLYRAGLTYALPVINLAVASNNSDTLTITTGSTPLPPDLTTILAVGDLLTMRSHGSINSATTIGDANFVNFYGSSGLTANAEVGNTVHIPSGTGKGQSRVIISNTTTTLTVAPWHTQPDSTSVFVIAEGTWRNANYTDSAQVSNPNPGSASEVAVVSVSNVYRKPWLVRMITCDRDNNESLNFYAPMREVYQEGTAGTPPTPQDGFYTIPYAATITPDLANGLNQRCTLTGNVAVNLPISASPAAGDWVELRFINDSTAGHTITFNAGYRGLTNRDPDTSASISNTYGFTYDGTYWNRSYDALGASL